MNKKWYFIGKYLLNTEAVSVTDEEFVDSYIKEFNVKHKVTLYGAYKCYDLGRQLSQMYKRGFLDRFIIGINAPIDGFPKWVYTYSLRREYFNLFKDNKEI